MNVTHLISALGTSGDGIAETAQGRVFVPFTLPGERINLAINGNRADATAILDASPERVEPPCPHFTHCGGCALQHWRSDAYRAWKRGLVVGALAAAGIEADVEDLVSVAPGARRRAVFSAQMTSAGLAFGFRRAMSHAVEPVTQCLVATPAITQELDALKALAAQLAPLAKGAFHLTVTATATGLDIRADDVRAPGEAQRRALVQAVLGHGFARLSVKDDVIVTAREPMVLFDGIGVTPPPGGFLQAASEAEQAMQAIVGGYLDGARRIADLFSGSGTFALPLGRRSTVHAVEGDGAALTALDKAWRNATGSGIRMKPVSVEKRDLFIRPLTAKELSPLDAVVFDPPRAGAEAQATQLAKSTIKRIAAVSCNPVTLARDLKILTGGGYRVLSVTPLDQFLWTPHVEAVALLARG
ncbi:MAG: RNA methyltransferase [Rhizobiaceae bacterium]|nr:RNA methyltransferase [Rhizobiaceae bacterium]